MNLIVTMRLNALSCIGFGALFALLPNPVAAFLSDTPVPAHLLLGLGVVLVLNGLHILWAARQLDRARKWRIYFSLGDFAWVGGTAALIVAELWITTTPGVVAAIAVAAVVGFFGVRQLQAGR
ncbi:MAG: hypothetical protein P8J20_04890 [Novosphingobium sp.]|nr:hypothetical protein [Novosphingobium sp.]